MKTIDVTPSVVEWIPNSWPIRFCWILCRQLKNPTNAFTFYGLIMNTWVILILYFFLCIIEQNVFEQPKKDANIYLFLYFVCFIVFGVLICANLVAGLLVKEILSIGNLNDVFVSSKKPKTETANSNHASRPDENASVKIAVLLFCDFIFLMT